MYALTPSSYCNHGSISAALKDIQSIAFTDHDRYVDGVNFDVIDRLREQNPDIEILAGIELDNDPRHFDRRDSLGGKELGSARFCARFGSLLQW